MVSLTKNYLDISFVGTVGVNVPTTSNTKFFKVIVPVKRKEIVMFDKDVRTCKKCGKKYVVIKSCDHFPGGKEQEEIICPWDGHVDGVITTSGIVRTEKFEDTSLT